MRVWITAIMLVCQGVGFAINADVERASASAAYNEFQAAYDTWNPERFAAATRLFREQWPEKTRSPAQWHCIAVSEFHRMLSLERPPVTKARKAAREQAMKASESALTKALALDDSQAEAHALLGTIYGMQIGGNVFRAMKLGPRTQQHLTRALDLAPKNPRVRYLAGACQFHAAKKKSEIQGALATLLEAEKLFASETGPHGAAGRVTPPTAGDADDGSPLDSRPVPETSSPSPEVTPLTAPRWGRGNCLVFIGRSYEALRNFAQAATYYRKALAMRPSDSLAKEGLARALATKP